MKWLADYLGKKKKAGMKSWEVEVTDVNETLVSVKITEGNILGRFAFFVAFRDCVSSSDKHIKTF